MARFGRSFPIRPHLPKMLVAAAGGSASVEVLPLATLWVAELPTVAGGANAGTLPLAATWLVGVVTAAGGATTDTLPLAAIWSSEQASASGGANTSTVPLAALWSAEVAAGAGGANTGTLPLAEIWAGGVVTPTGGADTGTLPLAALWAVEVIATPTGGATVAGLPLASVWGIEAATGSGGAVASALGPLGAVWTLGQAVASEEAPPLDGTGTPLPLVAVWTLTACAPSAASSLTPGASAILSRRGLDLTALLAAPPQAGSYWLNNGTEYLVVKNAGAAAVTVTIAYTLPFNGVVQTSHTVSVAAGKTLFIGPLAQRLYNDTSQLVHVTYSSVTDVTVAVFRVG